MKDARAVYIPQFHKYLHFNDDTAEWEWNKYRATEVTRKKLQYISTLPLFHGIDVLRFWEEAE